MGRSPKKRKPPEAFFAVRWAGMEARPYKESPGFRRGWLPRHPNDTYNITTSNITTRRGIQHDDIEKFTQRAQEAIGAAQEAALRRHHQQVDGEHLHYALLNPGGRFNSKRLLGIMGCG